MASDIEIAVGIIRMETKMWITEKYAFDVSYFWLDGIITRVFYLKFGLDMAVELKKSQYYNLHEIIYFV